MVAAVSTELDTAKFIAEMNEAYEKASIWMGAISGHQHCTHVLHDVAHIA
jgi:hypothetical protein